MDLSARLSIRYPTPVSLIHRPDLEIEMTKMHEAPRELVSKRGDKEALSKSRKHRSTWRLLLENNNLQFE